MRGNNSKGSRAASGWGFMAPCAVLLAYGVLGAVATVPSTPVHAQSFSGLGVPPRGTSCHPQDMNADGTVVVGDCSNATGIDIEAFRWTQAGGMVGLGVLPGGHRSFATGVNADGTIVVGYSNLIDKEEAFRWTQAGGMAGLGFLPGRTNSAANGVNADGTVVIGFSDSYGNKEALRWTQAGGMASLGFLPGGTSSQAKGVNADGTVVVGYSRTLGVGEGDFIHILGGSEAFRWTQAGGMAGLGFLTGGTSSEAEAVNGDGTLVVGTSNLPAGGDKREAFRWTQAGGMAGLGFLPGGSFSQAAAVNADGTVVAGTSNLPGGGDKGEAFRWTQAGGMRSVQALLSSKGINTTGWTLYSVRAVSADGQVMVGYGRDPNGHYQGWIARLGQGPP